MGSNLQQVAGLEPDYLGFIFWEPSARYFEGRQKLDVSMPKIGVFVDAQIKEILDHVHAFELEGVQLHGKESPEFCEELKNRLSTLEREILMIKAFQIGPGFPIERTEDYAHLVDFFLFDARGELPGGNGIGFNWELLNAYQGITPYFLSGGIGPGDAEKIHEFLHEPVSALCHAIDVNSGFEIEPGLKNIERLKPFVTLIQKLQSEHN